MFISFYIPEHRLEELKSYIEKELSTAKYYSEPSKVKDNYLTSLVLERDDCYKLNEVLKEWKKEDTTEEEKRLLPLQEAAKKLQEKNSSYRIPYCYVFVTYENGARMAYHITKMGIEI